VARSEEAVQAATAAQNAKNTRVFVLPHPVNGIGETRQAIIDNHVGDKIIMMDDDLTFACRGKRTDNPLYLSPMDDASLHNAITWMWDGLDDYHLVGLGAREGNNRKPEPEEKCCRMMRAWGLRIDTFRKHKFDFTRINCMEDFDVILQFLTHGYENIVSNVFVTNQAGSNTAGGCQTYRTLEVQGEAAKTLASLYPEFVKVVEKETKTAWGGGKRLDVNVQWKKAYASSQRKTK
jgi:hypothetical protein